MAPQEEPARKPARASRGPAVLAAMINGVPLADIAKAEQTTPKHVERLLRNQLRKRWIAPAQDYARLQIVRLEAIAAQLKNKTIDGDLPTIDRLLKILDRLDRYHGFTRLAALATPAREDVRPKLIAKLGQGARESARDK